MTSEQLVPEKELAYLRQNIDQAAHLAELAYKEALENKWEHCYYQLFQARYCLIKGLAIALKNDTTP